MDIKNYGGNSVKQFEFGKLGMEILGSGPYSYYIYETKVNEDISLYELRSFSVYVFFKPDQAIISVQGLSKQLEQGDCLQVEDCDVQFHVHGGSVKFLVAGTSSPHPSLKGIALTRNEEIYKVEKPWGHELWINGQHPCYALKEIFIKAGTKTSLQYHNYKQETNVLFLGTVKLHYKNNKVLVNNDVKIADTASVQIGPISSIDVLPGTLHRLEAITDVLLYETSTPHLDDVVRVQDDSNRKHGRINKEHEK
jgi:mannose-6-phosphate isomerase